MMPGRGRSSPAQLGSGHLLGHPCLTCSALQPAQHRTSRALGLILLRHLPSATDVLMPDGDLLCLQSACCATRPRRTPTSAGTRE